MLEYVYIILYVVAVVFKEYKEKHMEATMPRIQTHNKPAFAAVMNGDSFTLIGITRKWSDAEVYSCPSDWDVKWSSFCWFP